MKRTLTSIAAASMALGMLVPVAFASTTSTSLSKAGQLPIVVNGSVLSNPYEMTGKDSGNTTGFFPIYYFNSALSKIGFSATWNGTTHTWAITAPGVTPAAIDGGVGTGNTTVTVNGTTVKKFNTQVAKDPAGGPVTTYLPIYYINKVLTGLGVKGNFSGQTGLSLTGGAVAQTGAATLSAVKATGATTGDGTVTSPALSLTGSAITLSTTLSDANGNAIPNTAVTFNVSNYGAFPVLPTVKDANGTVVSGTTKDTAEQYKVYTDASGVASIAVTGPSGQTYSYEVTATAPYADGSGNAITSAPAYAEFVANNQAGLSPFATSGNPYTASLGSAVPITVTLPPNAQGQPQANVLVTLKTTVGSFVNASGSVVGPQVDVTTNSEGVAQVNLSSATAKTGGYVYISSGLPSGVNDPGQTYINFAQAGVASKITNFSITQTSATQPANIGTNVYVSGQLLDASGNPVANGQVLVTSPNNNGGNDFAYVSGTTTTKFPLVSSVTGGTPATSAYGDVVKADAAGNFSFELTNTRANAPTPEVYHVYAITNGVVAGQSGVVATDLVPTASDNNVYFGQSTTLAKLSIGAFDSYVQGNSDTTLAGLTAQADNGAGPALTNVNDNGSNAQIADVYFEPQNSAGKHGALSTVSLSYTLTADNGGLIYSINGTKLTNAAAAVTLTYTPTLVAGVATGGTFTANGQTIGTLANPAVAPSMLNVNTASHFEDFEVGVVNGNTGATTLTATSGTVSSTAKVTFSGGTPAMVGSFTPGSASVNPGGNETITFNIQDANGNSVPNTAAKVFTDGSTNDPFFVTMVNSAKVEESLNLGTTNSPSMSSVATPIPLGALSNYSNLNYNVSIPGVAYWTNGANYFTVYSDASGNVSLTLQAGGLTYPSQAGVSAGVASNNVDVPTSVGYLGFYSNTDVGDANGISLYIQTGVAAPSASVSAAGTVYSAYGKPVQTETFTGSLQGQLGW